MKKIRINSRNGEAYAVADRIIATYQQSNLKDNNILAKLMYQVISLNQELSSAINRMKAESDLEEKDLARDNDFRSLYHLVQGATFHPQEDIHVAAQMVFTYLEHYGLDITRENYDSETSQLDSLLTDLNATELQSAIAKLNGCAELVDKLKASQQNFKDTRTKYQKEQSQNAQHTNATDLKHQIIEHINHKLLVYLSGMMVAEEEVYATLVANIERIISEHNKVVKMRLS